MAALQATLTSARDEMEVASDEQFPAMKARVARIRTEMDTAIKRTRDDQRDLNQTDNRARAPAGRISRGTPAPPNPRLMPPPGGPIKRVTMAPWVRGGKNRSQPRPANGGALPPPPPEATGGPERAPTRAHGGNPPVEGKRSPPTGGPPWVGSSTRVPTSHQPPIPTGGGSVRRDIFNGPASTRVSGTARIASPGSGRPGAEIGKGLTERAVDPRGDGGAVI